MGRIRPFTIAITRRGPGTMYDDIVIRDVHPDELTQILRINAESAPAVTQLSGPDIANLSAGAALCWVAVADQSIAGYLIAFLSSAGYDGEEFAWFRKRIRDFVYVDQLALARSYRRRGLGSKFYAKLEQWAREHLCRSLSCEVNIDPPNPASVGFHASCGFVEVGRMYTADGRHVALLQKKVG